MKTYCKEEVLQRFGMVGDGVQFGKASDNCLGWATSGLVSLSLKSLTMVLLTCSRVSPSFRYYRIFNSCIKNTKKMNL